MSPYVHKQFGIQFEKKIELSLIQFINKLNMNTSLKFDLFMN